MKPHMAMTPGGSKGVEQVVVLAVDMKKSVAAMFLPAHILNCAKPVRELALDNEHDSGSPDMGVLIP